jgi:hypothetical protein
MLPPAPALAPAAEPISLLDHDDDLAAAVPPTHLDSLRARLRCRTFVVGPGPWRPPTAEPDVYGLYVVDGLLVRRLQVGAARSAEIVGPSDVLRPWQEDTAELLNNMEARWTVPTPSRLAILDAEVTSAVGSIPTLDVALSGRLLRRARELAYLAALSHLVKVHERLLGTLWHLAERWGRVTARGVVLQLPFTHEVLAEVVGAQRPSLTTGISTLEQRGLISREDGHFVLHGDPPQEPGTPDPLSLQA